MKIDGCFRLNDKNIPQIESFSVFKGTNKIIKEKFFYFNCNHFNICVLSFSKYNCE